MDNVSSRRENVYFLSFFSPICIWMEKRRMKRRSWWETEVCSLDFRLEDFWKSSNWRAYVNTFPKVKRSSPLKALFVRLSEQVVFVHIRWLTKGGNEFRYLLDLSAGKLTLVDLQQKLFHVNCRTVCIK